MSMRPGIWSLFILSDTNQGLKFTMNALTACRNDNFRKRRHVVIEDQLNNHEMSINFRIPNIPYEGWSKFIEFHVAIGDKFKTHEMNINFSHPKLYQPKDEWSLCEFHVATEN